MDTISKWPRFLCYAWKHLILWFQVLKTGTFWYLKIFFDFAQNCPFQAKNCQKTVKNSEKSWNFVFCKKIVQTCLVQLQTLKFAELAHFKPFWAISDRKLPKIMTFRFSWNLDEILASFLKFITSHANLYKNYIFLFNHHNFYS